MKTSAIRTITKTVASLTLLLVVTSIYARSNDNIELVSVIEGGAVENEVFIQADLVELESWMIEPAGWSANQNDYLENDFEESMSIESWMTDLDETNWEMEKESEMELENWMTKIDNTSWSTENTIDESQELEAWMLNPSEWLTK